MFKSFFLAGFECATGYNARREWIDQIAATQHDRHVDEDYRLLTECGIHAVREAVRWPLVDRKAGYDFSTVEPVAEAARRHGLDVIWDIFHYGYPSSVDLFSPEFPERFADYCYATARFIERHSDAAQLYFTPVNEPSYLSWAAGHAGLFAPHCRERGFELKVSLIRAAIQGIDAIWAAVPSARIVNVDALCRVVPPQDAPDGVLRDVAHFNDRAVFESWDMLAGRMLPELGGSPKHLDMVGINYYWTNQWQIDQVGTPLRREDERCWSLGQMIRWAHERTGHPVVVTETGHVDENRPWWMLELGRECAQVIEDGIPLLGVCLYPVLGMPEWHEPEVWTRMGLWDLHPAESDRGGPEILKRVPHEPTHAAFAQARTRLESLLNQQQTQAVSQAHHLPTRP